MALRLKCWLDWQLYACNRQTQASRLGHTARVPVCHQCCAACACRHEYNRRVREVVEISWAEQDDEDEDDEDEEEGDGEDGQEPGEGPGAAEAAADGSKQGGE